MWLWHPLLYGSKTKYPKQECILLALAAVLLFYAELRWREKSPTQNIFICVYIKFHEHYCTCMAFSNFACQLKHLPLHTVLFLLTADNSRESSVHKRIVYQNLFLVCLALMQLGCLGYTSVISIVDVYSFIQVYDLKERHCRGELSKEGICMYICIDT